MKRDRDKADDDGTTAFDPETIPGVGIIRARSLRKAGYGTLDALKGASAEQLQAVPGITPAKAAQIVAYVESLDHDAASPPPAESAVVPEQPVAPKGDLDGAGEAPAAEVEPVTYAAACAAASRRVAALAAWYLQPPQYGRLRKRLARQLARAALVAGALADRPSAIPEDAGPIMRRLGQLAAAVGAVALDRSAGRKQQSAWADALRRRRRQLERVVQVGSKGGNDDPVEE